MQRNLISILLLAAAALVSVAAGSWWVRATALSPSTGVGATEAILDDEEIRGEIVTIVSAATADRLGQPASTIAGFIDPILDSRAGAAVMAEIVAAGHARLIGENSAPLRIDGPQMVLIVRDEVVMDLPPVTLPIAEVSALATVKSVLWWTTLIPGILALLICAFAILARPERRDVHLALAALCASMAMAILFFGLVMPIWVLPAFSETTWIGALPRLATRTLIVAIPAILALTALGVVAWVTAGSRPRRNQWSTPISSARYGSNRNWYR